MISFFRDMPNLLIIHSTHCMLRLIKSSLLFSFIETRCQKKKIRWELFSTFLTAFVSWEGFFSLDTTVNAVMAIIYLTFQRRVKNQNPFCFKVHISTCHGIQLSVYMFTCMSRIRTVHTIATAVLWLLTVPLKDERTTKQGIREIREDRSVSRPFLTILARFTGWNAG